MKRWLPVIVALGASLGVVLAYLLAGGGSYEPLKVADPCEPRPPEVLAERGVFEGILLSGLDGAACELGVSREELAAALADEGTLEEFAAAHGIDQAAVEEAVRAGLVRAVDDAHSQGRLPEPIASIARGAAENAPVSTVIDLFEAIPGDPSLAEVIDALGQAGLTIQDIGDVAIPEIQGLLDDLGGFGDDLGGLLPQVDPGGLPDELGGLIPEGTDPADLQQELQDLLG